MMYKFKGLIFLTFAACAVSACDVKKSEIKNAKDTLETPKEIQMTETPKQPPLAIFKLPEQQLGEIAAVLTAITKVISKQSELSEQEVIFGKGTNHMPKDGTVPRLRIYRESIEKNGFSLTFEKLNDKDPWSKATFGVNPQTSANGVYLMNLPIGIFDNLKFEKGAAISDPAEMPSHVNVFEFSSVSNNQKLHYKFEAAQEVSNLKDKYPKSFHSLEVTRLEN
jgi:hypothetical protein